MSIATETSRLLICALADERYALPMHEVREVIRWRPPTPLPGTPPTILGVLHHRGAVLPLADIRGLLGLSAPAPTRSSRVVIVERDGVSAGLVADAVADIVDVGAEAIEPPPPALPAARGQFLAGLLYESGAPVALLALGELLEALTAVYAA